MNGDVNAFGALVEKYEKMIYNLALNKVGSREDAQDITQECFLRAYKTLRGYRADAAFSTWIYTIAKNLIHDFYRANKNKKTAEIPLSVKSDEGEFTELEIADNSSDPSELFLRNEKIKKIREIIKSLPDDMRDILIMRDINNMSYAEISECLDTEIGTVKSRLNRAREKLKKYILETSLVNEKGELL